MLQSKINLQLSTNNVQNKKFHDPKSFRKQKTKNLLLTTNPQNCLFCIKSTNNTKHNNHHNPIEHSNGYLNDVNTTDISTNLCEIENINSDTMNMKKSDFHNFPRMINKALYSKYSSSQNYYYTKDINDMLAQARTISVIIYKDYITLDEEEEYLKRYYKRDEWKNKINILTEYYKYHKDIARLFMMPSTNVLNKYHDKNRRLEYIRVTKILKEEQDNKNGIIKKKEDIQPRTHISKEEMLIQDRILDNLDITLEQNQTKSIIQEMLPPKTERMVGSYGNLAYKPPPQSTANSLKVPGFQLQFQKVPGGRTDKSIEVSNTLQDLNAKLGEIISNSRCHNLEGNYLDTAMNETITNLNNFLLFLNKNPVKFDFEMQVTNNRPSTADSKTITKLDKNGPKFDKTGPKLENPITTATKNKIKIDKIDFFHNEKLHKNTHIIDVRDAFVHEIRPLPLKEGAITTTTSKNQAEKNENERLSTRKMAVSSIPNTFRSTGGQEEYRRSSQDDCIQNTPKTNMTGNTHHAFGLMTMSSVENLQFARDGLRKSPSQNNLSKQALTIGNSSKLISKTPCKNTTPTPTQKIKNFDELVNLKIKSNVPKSASRENSAKGDASSVHPVNSVINSARITQKSPRVSEDRELLLAKTAYTNKIQNSSTSNMKQRILTTRNSQNMINFGDAGGHGKSDSSSRNGSFLKKDSNSSINKIATNTVMNFIKKDLMEVYGSDLKTTRPHHSRVNSQIQLPTTGNIINFKKIPISATSTSANSQMMNTFSSKDLKHNLGFADKKAISSMPTSKRDSIVVQGVQNSARGAGNFEEIDFIQSQLRLGTHKHTKSETNLNMMKMPSYKSTSVVRGGGGQGITVGSMNLAVSNNNLGNSGFNNSHNGRLFDEKSDKTPKAHNYGQSGVAQQQSMIAQNNINSNITTGKLAQSQQNENKGRGKNGSNSPNKGKNAQVYTYNNNNIVNIFLNPQSQDVYPVIDLPQKSTKSIKIDKRKDSYNQISASPLKNSNLKSRGSVNMLSTSRKF